MPVRKTSLLAYVEVLEKIGIRQTQVLKCLGKFYSASNLIFTLGIFISTSPLRYDYRLVLFLLV